MAEARSVFELDVVELLEMNGGLLVSIREELGLSPQQMADRLGCDRSTLNRYENDRIKSIPASLVARVKKLLDEERAGRGVRVSPERDGGEPPTSSPVSTIPVTLARGPLAPGTKLVETVPTIELSAPISRTFVAVEGGGAPGTSDTASAGARPDAPPRRASAPRRGGDSGLRAWALVMSAVGFCLFTGCFLAHRAAQQTGLEEPSRVPDEIDTDDDPQEAGGAKTATRRSIPLPEKAYSWQKLAPCRGGQTEKVGGCWEELANEHPPCPEYAVESEGQCFMPIPAKPKRPNTVTPKQ